MADTLSYRQNIDGLGAADLAQFRAGMARAMSVSDNRGYQHFAGMHGLPQHQCYHHQIFFLPWHRAYLYTLELHFRELSAGFTLAYWDWTSAPSHAGGVPAAYRAANDAAGNPNPLLRGMRSVPDTCRHGTRCSSPASRSRPIPNPAGCTRR